MKLSKEILKIPAKEFKVSPKYYGEYKVVYNIGHKDALKAASEASLKYEKRIEELEAIVKAFVDWQTDETGTKSLLDDEELWSRAEQILK